MNGFVGVGAEGSQSGTKSLQTVGSTHYGGHGSTVEGFGEAVSGHVGHVGVADLDLKSFEYS